MPLGVLENKRAHAAAVAAFKKESAGHGQFLNNDATGVCFGGTYAHKNIAFKFASWVSVEFKLYLIKEFQRLKDDENRGLSLAWNLNRALAKVNCRIHTILPETTFFAGVRLRFLLHSRPM